MSSSSRKEKSSRSPTEDNNTSLMKSLTSKVTELLPSSITKWFNNSSTSNANGSVKRSDDGTDSSSEEDVIQPPAKRMRLSPISAGFNQYIPTENNVPDPAIEHLHSTAVHSPQSSTLFRLDQANFASIPLQQNNETIEKKTPERSAFNPQHSQTLGRSIAAKRKSLFGNDSPSSNNISRSASLTSSNTLQDSKKPYFKPTLLSSTFYPGQTTYGGASSPYIQRRKLTPRKSVVVNTANDCNNASSDNTISQSTKRIMELLEQYSSPLQEAKRMSQFMDETKSSSSLIDNTSLSSSRISSYRNQELQVPSIASILSMKKRRLMETTSAARQIIASHSSTADCTQYSQEITKRDSPQMLSKEKINPAINQRKELPGSDITEKSMVTVGEPQIPKFTSDPIFSASGSHTSVKIPPITTCEGKKGQLNKTTSNVVTSTTSKPFYSFGTSTPKIATTSTTAFKFSSPVTIATGSTKHDIQPNKFTFGYPDSCKVKDKEENSEVTTLCLEKVTEQKQPSAMSKWQCENCWVFNQIEVDSCVCCGAKRPTQEVKKQPKCSLCKVSDSKTNSTKCSTCEKAEVTSSKIQESKTLSPGTKWKCEFCWVSNEEHVDKCVCCGGKNTKQYGVPVTSKEINLQPTGPIQNNSMPKSATKWKCPDCWVNNDDSVEMCVCCGGKNPKPGATNLQPTESLLNNSMPKSATKWKCPDCWVSNDDSAEKCVCCGGKNVEPVVTNMNNKSTSITPIPFKNTSTLIKPIDNNFDNIVKKQTEKWECPSCLVCNDSKQEKCACCEAEKPGTQKKETVKTFNFGVVPNTFKFGIDPSIKESNEQKEIKQIEAVKESELVKESLLAEQSESVKQVEKNHEESETNNNILAKVPTFTFALPLKKPDDQGLKVKGAEVPKVNFSFGMPKQTSTSGSPSAKDQNNKVFNTFTPVEEKETVQEVPKVNLPISTQKIDMPNVPTIFSDSVVSQISDQPSGFKLPSVISINSNPSLEEKKNTTSSTGITFETTVASTTSKTLFSKPNETISTSSLFQTNTTSTPFKFTSSTEQQPQAEKPKFNFSFNANKNADTAPTFTFGSTERSITTQESTSSVNTFKPSVSNSLGSGNAIPAPNSLSNNNNPLSGNTTQGVTLGNGPVNSISSGISNNPLLNNNSLTPNASTGLFGQKENNMWSPNNNTTTTTSLFASSAQVNTPKPAFNFGSSASFSATNNAAKFGSTTTNNNQAVTFGSSRPQANVFGTPNQTATSNAPSLFSSPTPVQNTTPAIFGGQQLVNNPLSSPVVFGTQGASANATFGTSNPSLPSFEAPPINTSQTPSFNFTGQSNAVFGFGQQQSPNAGAFSFGAPSAPVQFNMGSSSSSNNAVAGRRMRKAIRRTQR